MKYYIKTAEWQIILSYLKSRKDIRTGNEEKLRLFLEAIWYISRSGCQWRLLPSYYGSWRAVHRRFKRWSEKGVFEDLFEYVKQEPDKSEVMLDSTIVRAHACSSGLKKDRGTEECLGRSRGGFTTKIHTIVDALGNPLKFLLTPGQRNDITQAEELVIEADNSYVVCDKGYDSSKFVKVIEEAMGCKTVIPSRKNRKVKRDYDEFIYKERHLVECFFGKIKHFRRIFSRFDKAATTFMTFLHFVSSLIWIR